MGPAVVGFLMVFAGLVVPVRSGAQGDAQALDRVVASERAFAAATAELGVRDGFLAFFAADSVQIAPESSGRNTRLVPARLALTARPLPRLPPPIALVWNPHTGQVSEDGSLGWLTGPFITVDRASARTVGHGAYFSVWKRQADGTFRVWLDEGVELPAGWSGAGEFHAAPSPDLGRVGTSAETIDAAEASVATHVDAWQARLGEHVRLHRQGRMPLAGRREVVAWAKEAWASVRYTLVHVERAASNDLAIVVGGYEARTAGVEDRGTWVRVWQRDADGRWQIVFETSKTVA